MALTVFYAVSYISLVRIEINQTMDLTVTSKQLDIFHCHKLSITISLLWTSMMLSLFLFKSFYAWKCMKNAVRFTQRRYASNSSHFRGLRCHAESPKAMQIDLPPNYEGLLNFYRGTIFCGTIRFITIFSIRPICPICPICKNCSKFQNMN